MFIKNMNAYVYLIYNRDKRFYTDTDKKEINITHKNKYKHKKKTLKSESYFVLPKFFRLTVYLYKIQMLRYLNYISFDFFFYFHPK